MLVNNGPRITVSNHVSMTVCIIIPLIHALYYTTAYVVLNQYSI